MSNNYFFIFRGFTFDESMPVLIIVCPCSGCQLQITILHLPFIVICCHRVKKICINYAFANGKTAPGRKRYEQVSSGHMLYAPLQTAENAHLYLFWRGNVEKYKSIPPQGGGDADLAYCLADLFYFSRAYAARAYVYAHVGAMRSHRLYALDVRFGYFLRFVVGMTHLITAEFALAANFTCSCHSAVLHRLKNLG